MNEREIKFRAWGLGKMRPVTSVSESTVICGITPFHREAVRLMQFTGLKDSKGVEIYEGDVVYIAGYGLYVVEFPFIELYQAGLEGDIGEIKGNIWENPEIGVVFR